MKRELVVNEDHQHVIFPLQIVYFETDGRLWTLTLSREYKTTTTNQHGVCEEIFSHRVQLREGKLWRPPYDPCTRVSCNFGVDLSIN